MAINETRHTVTSAPEDATMARHVKDATLSKTRQPKKTPQMIGQDPSDQHFLPPRRQRRPNWLFKDKALLRNAEIMTRLMALGIGADNLQDLPWTYEWYTFYKDFPRSGGCAHCESHAMTEGYAPHPERDHTTAGCPKSWITAQYTVYGPDYELETRHHRRYKLPPFVQRFLTFEVGRSWVRFMRNKSHDVQEARDRDAQETPASLADKQAFLDLCGQYTRQTTTTQDSDLHHEDNILTLDLGVVQATAVKNLPPNPLILTPTSVQEVTADENLQDDVDQLQRATQHAHGPRLRTALGNDFTATDARQEIFATTNALQTADARPYFDVLFD
jgi:hypothetical protein